jgi:hypothetical protein
VIQLVQDAWQGWAVHAGIASLNETAINQTSDVADGSGCPGALLLSAVLVDFILPSLFACDCLLSLSLQLFKHSKQLSTRI